MGRLHGEALEINTLIDELMEQGAEISAQEADGRKGSPVDYLPKKDFLANESLKTMAMVLEHKYKLRGHAHDREWSLYLFDIYRNRQKELETALKK